MKRRVVHTRTVHTHTHRAHTHKVWARATPTLPARFAHRLDVDADRDTTQRPLLAAVPGRDLDLVLLLSVIAQLLRVPDVTWRQRHRDFVKVLQAGELFGNYITKSKSAANLIVNI